MRFILCVLILFIPMTSHAMGALDQIQQQYQISSSSWMNQAIVYANHLFAGLAVIEFVWSGMQYLLKKNDLADLIGAITLKVVSLFFFYSLLILAPQWLPLIITSFSQAGSGISGVSSLSPSAVFNLGPQIANQLILALGSPSLGLQALGSYLFSAISAGLSALIIVLAFGFAALQLLITLIESYLVIGGGALMLGFLGSRWTLPFGERYLGYAVSVGIKLFVLYLIVGLGPSLAQSITQDLQQAAVSAGTNSPPPGSFFTACAIALIYGALCFMIPGLAGSFMNGHPSLSLGNVATGAAFAAGTGLGIGAAGLSMGAQLANQTIGAAKAFGSAVNLARKDGFTKAARQTGGSLGGMIKDRVSGQGENPGHAIASQLQGKQVTGLGANTLGGELANRIRLSDREKLPSSEENLPSHSSQKTSTSLLNQVAEQHLNIRLPHDGSSGGTGVKLNHTD